MEYRRKFKYVAKKDSKGNFIIERNDEVILIADSEFGRKHFDMKILEIQNRGESVEDML